MAQTHMLYRFAQRVATGLRLPYAAVQQAALPSPVQPPQLLLLLLLLWHRRRLHNRYRNQQHTQA
jgi:hypothetical protein